MKAKGLVFKYGDNVDTDVIIPARYLNSSVPEELAEHCMEDIDKEFVKKVKKGDIIVADKNFGCGSSREHAPIAIKASGISCVIAETFARFSTVMLLISVFRLLNVRKRLPALRTEMKWKWTLTAESFIIERKGHSLRDRHFQNLCRRLFRQKV